VQIFFVPTIYIEIIKKCIPGNAMVIYNDYNMHTSACIHIFFMNISLAELKYCPTGFEKKIFDKIKHDI
jgi:hypothetical protein